jgi:2',3'-cyclic-nucleotide 2'-phosphodiesterase (5'-nucleotidase family)
MTPLRERSRSIFDDEDDVSMGGIHLRILSTSDVYSFDNWARFFTAVQELKLPEDEDGNYNVVLIPGDFLAPSVISCVDHGASMVDCLNEIGFQYCCFGNHETDVPLAALGERIKESKFKWINSNMVGLPPQYIPDVPEYEVISMASETQSRSVAIIGLLTDDKFLYRSDSFGGAKIKPVADTALRMHERLKGEVDCIIPLTHQSMAHDRHLAMIASDKFPVIIGGHDHSPFTETVAGVPIIKAGMDAINLAITDIVWPSKNTIGSSPDVFIQLIPVKRFEPNLKIQELVTGHQTRVLSSLDAAHLVDLRRGVALTSRNIRMGQTTIGTFITSLLRDALSGDCCVLPSGTIRRNWEYQADHESFSYRDLVSELPFDDDIVVVDFPGSVIEAAVQFSHGPLRKGMGGFLQVDSGMQLDPSTSSILTICGQSFNRNKTYRLVTNILALEGIDENVPLINFFEQKYLGEGPKEGDVRRVPVKAGLQTVVARRRLVQIWNTLGDALIPHISKEYFFQHELNAHAPDWFLDLFFKVLDFDGDGVIGVIDLAIACIFCWFAGPISGIEEDHTYRIDSSGTTTTDELRGHLEAIIPKKIAQEIVQGIVHDSSAFVTRAMFFNWLVKLRNHD